MGASLVEVGPIVIMGLFRDCSYAGLTFGGLLLAFSCGSLAPKCPRLNVFPYWAYEGKTLLSGEPKTSDIQHPFWLMFP